MWGYNRRVRDPRLVQLGEVLVRHCTGVRPGDLVTIVGEPGFMAPVEALFESVLRAGGHPSFHVRSEALRETVLRHGSDGQIGHVSPFEAHRLDKCDVLIVLDAQVESVGGQAIDPAKRVMEQRARAGMFSACLERAAKGDMRYVLSVLPTEVGARRAGMSLVAYTDWVYRAGFLHLPDPVGAWKALGERHERATAFLRRKSVLRFVVPGGAVGGEGTDLTVDVSGREWLSQAGGENFPDGEIESGPRGADGVVRFSFPVVHRGVEIDGVRLRFKGGRVVEASAERNEEYLVMLLDMDEGARVMGEIALGTNPEIDRATGSVFFDEKMTGTFHAAVGAGYARTGNGNRSALHLDMVCDLRRGGEVYADGKLILRDGRFVMEGWPGV